MAKCADPKLCYTSGTSRQLRHYSLSTPFFKARAQQVFNCGTCIFCRKRNSTELAIRCVLHASLYTANSFITLTYDEKKDDYHNNLCYKDIQDFKKRLRSHCDYHHQKKIQIFNVHEYGKNGKKHWHLVVFNYDFPDKTLYTVKNGNRLYSSKELEKLWPHGFNTVGDVTEASAMYQAQYTQKDITNGNTNNSRKSKSNHSGIARDYFLRHYKQLLTLGYIPFNGRKIPLPRYFVRLAHKHYCHFYEKSAFFDTPYRKAIHRPFKPSHENLEIADLYKTFSQIKQEKIDQIALEWNEKIENDLFSSEKLDSKISEENYLHDQKNKQNTERF